MNERPDNNRILKACRFNRRLFFLLNWKNFELIDVYLIYRTLLGSDVQQSDSVGYTHIYSNSLPLQQDDSSILYSYLDI